MSSLSRKQFIISQNPLNGFFWNLYGEISSHSITIWLISNMLELKFMKSFNLQFEYYSLNLFSEILWEFFSEEGGGNFQIQFSHCFFVFVLCMWFLSFVIWVPGGFVLWASEHTSRWVSFMLFYFWMEWFVSLCEAIWVPGCPCVVKFVSMLIWDFTILDMSNMRTILNLLFVLCFKKVKIWPPGDSILCFLLKKRGPSEAIEDFKKKNSPDWGMKIKN